MRQRRGDARLDGSISFVCCRSMTIEFREILDDELEVARKVLDAAYGPSVARRASTPLPLARSDDVAACAR
jgi:hypothetical protein